MKTNVNILAGFILTLLTISSAWSSEALKETVDEVYPAGDVYFFQGLSMQDEDNQTMRLDDYKNFYPLANRLSKMHFRVMMNWAADARDLELALQNTRPTIIIWSSHGDPKGLLDKDGEVIPFDIFQKASPNIYQFVISTCYGNLAIKKYDLSQMKTVKFSGWDDPLSSAMFKDFLEKWDFLENYPASIERENLHCEKSATGYDLIAKNSTVVSRLESKEMCYRYLFSAQNGLACAFDGDRVFKLFDTSTQKMIADSMIMTEISEQSCLELPAKIDHGKICYLATPSYEFKVYDMATHQSLTPIYPMLEDCNAAISK